MSVTYISALFLASPFRFFRKRYKNSVVARHGSSEDQGLLHGHFGKCLERGLRARHDSEASEFTGAAPARRLSRII